MVMSAMTSENRMLSTSDVDALDCLNDMLEMVISDTSSLFSSDCGVKKLTPISKDEQRINEYIQKLKKGISTIYCNIPTSHFLEMISSMNRAAPIEPPHTRVIKAAFPEARFQNIPTKNTAVTGGLIYACTACKY